MSLPVFPWIDRRMSQKKNGAFSFRLLYFKLRRFIYYSLYLMHSQGIAEISRADKINYTYSGQIGRILTDIINVHIISDFMMSISRGQDPRL